MPVDPMFWATRGVVAFLLASLWLACGSGAGVSGPADPGLEPPGNNADTVVGDEDTTGALSDSVASGVDVNGDAGEGLSDSGLDPGETGTPSAEDTAHLDTAHLDTADLDTARLDTTEPADSMGPQDAGSACVQEAPLGAVCNPYCQVGCDAAANCTVSINTIACVSPGSAGLDAACSTSADCQIGFACVPVDGPESGRCLAFCGSDADCAPDQSCGVTLSLLDEMAVSLCTTSTPLKTCDLLTQEGCAPQQGCYATEAGWTCLPAGSTGVGGACQLHSECTPGGGCVDGQCRAVCSAWVAAPLAMSCAEQCAAYAPIPPVQWGAAACLPPTSASTCTFWLQDCSGADDACYVLGGGATCLPAGSAEKGADCALISDCLQGLLCVGGSCEQPCSIDQNVPPPASICQFTCPGYTILNFESAVGLCD